jgi:hypothetical protein
MYELTLNECLSISGGEDDTFDLNDVFIMIENGESKLSLLGTLVAFGVGYYGAKIAGQYGMGYGVLGAVGGVVAGAYLLPMAFIVTYAMVDQSYRYFGFVK